MASMPKLSRLPKGDAHPVLLLPGFLASDDSTLVLRQYLLAMGYEPLPWALGRNTGRQQLFNEALVERFLQLVGRYGEKISLIGQSLGGVYARDIAHRFPDRVRQVITLGSPFGAMGVGATNPLVQALFARQSGLNEDEMREKLIEIAGGESPQVPTTAVFSKGDGVVNWRVCRESASHQTESIEVKGSHCGMGFNAAIYCVIADRLAQADGQWSPFEADQLRQYTCPVTAAYGF